MQTQEMNTTLPSDLVIEVKNLSKSFGKNKVLHDIDFNLKAGENLVVLGKSGSGKSVLIKCLVGLVIPNSGEINILGHDMLNLPKRKLNEVRESLGFLFQSAALYDSMTVGENLLFPLRRKLELSETDKNEMVQMALSDVGLEGISAKMPSELSGGMRKRLGLARTLIVNPKIMFYDEPTTGLDPITSREISELILNVQKKYACSSVIITHDMACAKLTANRMLVLKEGLIAASGSYEELEKSDDAWVHSLFI